MGDINFTPVWKELLKQAEEVKSDKNKNEVDPVIEFIKSHLK